MRAIAPRASTSRAPCTAAAAVMPPPTITYLNRRMLVLGFGGARMLGAAPVILLGIVTLGGRRPQPFLRGRRGIRHPHGHLVLLLPRHPPSRLWICLAWWRAWITWKRIHSSSVRSPRRGCLANRS